MIKKSVLFLFFNSAFFCVVFGQDMPANQKFWYSTYLYFKTGGKSYIDDYFLVATSSDGKKVSFFQNEIAYNYKVSNKFIVFSGLANYHYAWNESMRNTDIRLLSNGGYQTYFRGSIGLKYNLKLFKGFTWNQSLSFQSYFPSFDKYQSRVNYSSKLDYANKKFPLNGSLFAQISACYYLNGIPQLYQNGGVDEYLSSNGLHRIRYKLGFRFKPLKKSTRFSIVLYYSVQREFNSKILRGNDLNFRKNLPDDEKMTTYLPFNNYTIGGIQLNFIFGSQKKQAYHSIYE